MTTEGLSRRNALAGAATVGLGLPLLAACGSGSGSGTTTQGGGGAGGSGGSGGSAAGAIASTSDVPVGGGEVLASANLVLTQPTKGQFKCFTATCTHAGCQVANVDGGTINCLCHGSQFSITDGSPTAGPATQPLQQVKVAVKGTEIVQG